MVLKGPMGGLCPLKASFLHVFGQGSHNGTKVFDELVIERGQSMEALHFRDGGMSWPTFDGLNFGLINSDSLVRDNIAKKDNLKNE